ncbi:MAG TPA: hypothetical protein VKZ50_02680 [bacterium]|nr:hypothetical protein [bacterium]
MTESDRYAPPQPIPHAPAGRTYPHGGRWLAPLVQERFGSATAFARAVPMTQRGLARYFTDADFYPRRPTVEKIAQALSLRGAPVTADEVLDRFGGRTYEDHRRQEAQSVLAQRPPCPVCGRPVRRSPSRRASKHAACGRGCDTIWRITRAGVETLLGRWVVVIMAAAADVPAGRIARLVHVPPVAVTTWLEEWHGRVEEIRTAVRASPTRPHSLMQATAGVLGIERSALAALIHHRIRHPDKRHPNRRRVVTPAYLQDRVLRALAGFFSRSTDEVLAAAQRGTMTDFYKQHGPRASIQRFRPDQATGRLLKAEVHIATQFIVRALWRGDSLDAIRQALEDAELPGSHDPMWTAKQHALPDRCAPCRALMAAYLNKRQGKTLEGVGEVCGCTKVWAGKLVKRGLNAMKHPTPSLQTLLAKPCATRGSELPPI